MKCENQTIMLCKQPIRSDIRKLKQGQCHQELEHHLKMYLRVSEIISQYFLVIMPAKCVPIILELKSYKQFGD